MEDYNTEMDESQSDVNEEEVSSEPEEEVTEDTESVEGDEQSSDDSQEASEQPSEDPLGRLDQHPRFKELIEQKNNLSAKAQQYEQAVQQLQSRLEALEQTKTSGTTEEDALLARLKKIDPEFGSRFEELSQSQQELQDLRQWRSEMETKQLQSQIQSEFQSLHQSNKTPEFLQQKIEREISALASSDPSQFTTIEDLRKAYQSIHNEYNKYFDTLKREQTKSYSESKKKDAANPKVGVKTSPSKGKKKQDAESITDRDELLQSIAQEALSRSKADSDL